MKLLLCVLSPWAPYPQTPLTEAFSTIFQFSFGVIFLFRDILEESYPREILGASHLWVSFNGFSKGLLQASLPETFSRGLIGSRFLFSKDLVQQCFSKAPTTGTGAHMNMEEQKQKMTLDLQVTIHLPFEGRQIAGIEGKQEKSKELCSLAVVKDAILASASPRVTNAHTASIGRSGLSSAVEPRQRRR